MKARIKKTGEIAKIYGVDVRVGEHGSVTYYGADDVELLPDTPTTDGIDWEQRRFELVKSLAAGRMLRVNLLNYNKKSFVSTIVELADDIIAEYKKKGGED